MKQFLRLYLILTVVSLLPFGICHADNPIKINFSSPSDIMQRSLLQALKAQQITVTLEYPDSIDINAFEIWMVKCQANRLPERKLIGFSPANKPKSELCITVIPTDSTTASISIFPLAGEQTITADNQPVHANLLIECLNNSGYSMCDCIPILAYSSGHLYELKLSDGKTAQGNDICSVRYSGTHPRNWGSLFNIPYYIYFEAIPTTTIDYSKLY